MPKTKDQIKDRKKKRRSKLDRTAAGGSTLALVASRGGNGHRLHEVRQKTRGKSD